MGALAFAGVSTAWAAEEAMLLFTRGVSEKASREASPPGYPSADVKLDCLAGVGRFESCIVIEGAEPGSPVAAAAIKLSLEQRFNPKDRDGNPAVGRRFIDYIELLAPGDKNSDWLRKPTGEQLAGVFPVKAVKGAKDGSATIRCRVTIEGYLDRCAVLAESPKDYGFGSAALLLSKQFAMTPRIRAGRPVEGTVTIPIMWSGLSGSRSSSAVLSSKRLMTDPMWVSTPSPTDIAAAYPSRASDIPSGQATLRCDVTKTGQATSCQVISEIPPSRGFGAAAKTLAPKFTMAFQPADADQLRILQLEIPFRFRNPTAGDTGRLTDIRWVQTLSQKGADTLYPRAATAAKVDRGTGVVDCRAKADGGLEDCRVTREAPSDLGFGAAALQAAQLMRMNPWTKGGDPVEGRRVSLPITFVMPPPETPAGGSGAP